MLGELIIWAALRRLRKRFKHFRHSYGRVTDWNTGDFGMRRFYILHLDQWRDRGGRLHGGGYKLFNVFLHWWRPVHLDEKVWHDHPRWSVTVLLRGQLTEHTPKGSKVLRPGSIVFRSHKFIHKFSIEPEHRGRTWTLFFVGPRVHPQNVYEVVRMETPEAERTQPYNKVDRSVL